MEVSPDGGWAATDEQIIIWLALERHMLEIEQERRNRRNQGVEPVANPNPDISTLRAGQKILRSIRKKKGTNGR